MPESQHETIELIFPRKVTAKFVTAMILDSENYLDVADDPAHPDPNVDIQAIVFLGKKLTL